MWELKQVTKAKIRNPVLIEGLPGMGNVGKIAVDFMIDSLGAKKLMEIHSYNYPHCVFVNEENLVELPTIEVYYKNLKDKTLLFLAGDVQPLDERSCYEFCNKVLDAFKKVKCKEIIALGGIALQKVPKIPKVYCTGNSKKILKRYEKSRLVNMNLYGVVGPIVGVSGLLPGLAGRRNIPAVALLAETFGNPNYLGLRGAREILKVLNQELKLKLNLNELDTEVEEIEREMRFRTSKINRLMRRKKSPVPLSEQEQTHINYIG